MTALVCTPVGSRTFDVEQDGRVLGSVWKYADGWVAVEHTQFGYRHGRVIYESFDDACAALGAKL